jgi:hypothetical protein
MINMECNYISDCPYECCMAERGREAQDKAEAEAEAVKAQPEVPTSRILTREMVMKGSPCEVYRNRFIDRFPVSVEVTVDLALSQANDWDWDWAADELLSRKAKTRWGHRICEVEQDYNKTMRPYHDLVDAAYDEYYEVRGQAAVEAREKGLSMVNRYALMNKASENILSIPNAAADAARKIARKIEKESRARAWAELFIADAEDYEEEHKNDVPFVEPDWDENEDEDYDY